MNAVLSILIWVCVAMPFSPNQDNIWRGIVPLYSTRADVEKLIGAPNTPNGSMYDPRSSDGAVDRVFVQYSIGYCTKERKGGYNVPSGTVLQLAITWNKKQDFYVFQIDESKFEKSRDAEIPVIYYSNMEDGIMFMVEDGKLKQTLYFPTKKDDHLKCPK